MKNSKLTLAAVLIMGLIAVGAATLSSKTKTNDTGKPYVVPPTIAAVAPPKQPLPYSHKIHAGDLELDCQICHTGAEHPDNASGVKMSFPPTETCMACHTDTATDKPAIVQLKKYHDSHKPIPWARVYTIAKGVNWSHQTHLKAGIGCETCHGDVPALEVMSQTTGVAAMSSCISCHQAYKAKTQCQTCHAWPAYQKNLSKK